MEQQEHYPSYEYYRGLSIFQGLPDPGPIEDIENPEKVDNRIAELKAQQNIIRYYYDELDSLQERIIVLRERLNKYLGKPKQDSGLKIIEV